MKLLSSFVFFICYSVLYSQIDYSWWNKKHNWDGVTPWHNYITRSSAFMGPNALPVPDTKNGAINPYGAFEFTMEAHFSKGDKTQNIFSRFYVPFAKNKIAVQLYGYPIEYYNVDSVTRDKRCARSFVCKGFAVGDLYYETIINIVKEKKQCPSISIGLGSKTSSGGHLADARFTDTPGNIFDVSTGKSFVIKNKESTEIRLYSMIGLYSFQVNDNDNFQDDAFIYGIGVDFKTEHFVITNNFSGYIGYINNGDRPALYKLTLTSNNQKINYKIAVQMGIHDYPYNTFRIGAVYNLGLKK